MQGKENIAKLVRVEIRPSAEEYRQLCEDLGELRRRGAETNTAAIVEAVHAAVSAGRIRTRSANGKGARQRPQPRNRKVGS